MKKLSPTISPLILFILLVIAIGAADYFFYHAIEGENTQTFQIAEQISTQADQKRQSDSLTGLLQSSAPQRSSLEAQILPADGFVPFVESIEALGKQQGVMLTDSLATAADSNANGDSEFLTVQITISGSWDALTRMVSLLESMPYITSIDTIAFSKDQTLSTASKSIWDSSFTLNVEEFKSADGTEPVSGT